MSDLCFLLLILRHKLKTVQTRYYLSLLVCLVYQVNAFCAYFND